MKFDIQSLTLEVTRRCNLACEHCMRGDAQNVDMTYEMVDKILDNEEINSIDLLGFSGGEPTLNPDIIVYTINKIISNNIDVKEIYITTNGQVFDKKIADALTRFNEYRRNISRQELLRRPHSQEDLDKVNKYNFARISFSVDKYHKNISELVREKYNKMDIYVEDFTGTDRLVYKTGRSKVGIEYTYDLGQPRYYYRGGAYWLSGFLYLSAKGNLTGNGMGSYEDMDKLNMGSVYDMSIRNIAALYGKPYFDYPAIEYDSKKLTKK